MPRIGLLLLVALVATSVRADEKEQRFRAILAVQNAMAEAEGHLKKGSYQAAVTALERQIAHIDGNSRYLDMLREAYIGHIAALRKAGQEKNAALYSERLRILQPGALVSSPSTTPSAPKELPPKELAPAPKVSVRGKIDDRIVDDPFSAKNIATKPGTAGLIESAERAFAGKDFERACQMYEDAEAAQPGSAAACKERFAYCKLYRVAKTINGDGIPTGEELEREVEDAVKLAPKLETWAGQLRAKMREAVNSVPVKHTPREGKGWALAETANYRVFHATTEAQAARAARLAEAARTALANKWFGSVPPKWAPRCDIYLHPTVVGYTRAAKVATSHPGHSSIGMDPKTGEIASRRIDLRLDDVNLWTSTLPHEVTHVVLAGHFGKNQHLPRWADEGLAVLSEARARPALYTQMLPDARREAQLFRVEVLIKLDDYPDAKKVPLFYAQSISLVDFLVKKAGPVTFTKFIREGLASGYEPAMKKHYGYATFAEMEQDWLQSAFTPSVAKAPIVREKRRR
jgi:hypothetical protein